MNWLNLEEEIGNLILIIAFLTQIITIIVFDVPIYIIPIYMFLDGIAAKNIE